eukprot:14011091-Ditylum_brightwellii.AAC.1
MHNWLNTGQQRQKFYKDAVADCSVWHAKGKTWQHLLQCKHDDSWSIQTAALTQLKSDLLTMKTAPLIKSVL